MALIVCFVILGILLVFSTYVIKIYNGLVRLKNDVAKTWSNVDVTLKQRHDELPKLIETCKQHMSFESKTLEKIMQARAVVQTARESGNVQMLGPAEGRLRGLMGGLFAVAENYPELKASQSFQALHNRISGLENAIADRRELYNATVAIYNSRLEMFPDSWVAAYGTFPPASLLQFDSSETQDVNVSEMFKS